MNSDHQQAPVAYFEEHHLQHEKRKFSLSPNLLINIPIAQRLVLGFLLPALIAALAAGVIGIQSAQLLSQESNFYQSLFQSYSSLTTGNDYLQLMNYKVNAVVGDVQGPNASSDQLASDQKAVQGLETRYDSLLQDYVKKDLLAGNTSQIALFDAAGHSGQAAQQEVLASSAVRTWQFYRQAQDQILQEIQSGQYTQAETLLQKQGQLTYTDALSALSQLIQFDGRITTYVQDAAGVQERNELLTTLLAAVLVFFAIGVIGTLIYSTLVGRLSRLWKVAQAVQKGKMDTRVQIDGQDEITDVSTSVNTMLDTIVGLLEQSRLQRDAIISAAEHLFSEMRQKNDAEFDVKNAVSDDPIWMLGHAFNFAIGRFRRFVQRNQTTVGQLDAICSGINNLSMVVRSANTAIALGISTGLTATQTQEVARRTETLAQEVGGLAQNLYRVIQEMRASLAPFRSENNQHSQWQFSSASALAMQSR